MKRYYFLAFVLLFFLEVLISFTDGFIRYTLGDFFVVMLLYCLFRSFLPFQIKTTAILTLSIAFAIELLQLTKLSQLPICKEYPWLKLIIGTTFQWGDLLAYTLGVLSILWIDKKLNHEHTL